MKTHGFQAIQIKYSGQIKKTQKLWNRYEKLRPAYAKAFKNLKQGKAGVRKFNAICEEMQEIEIELVRIWKPYRRQIGTCVKCGGPRMLAVMGSKNGFGCANLRCAHFSVARDRKIAN